MTSEEVVLFEVGVGLQSWCAGVGRDAVVVIVVAGSLGPFAIEVETILSRGCKGRIVEENGGLLNQWLCSKLSEYESGTCADWMLLYTPTRLEMIPTV